MNWTDKIWYLEAIPWVLWSSVYYSHLSYCRKPLKILKKESRTTFSALLPLCSLTLTKTLFSAINLCVSLVNTHLEQCAFAVGTVGLRRRAQRLLFSHTRCDIFIHWKVSGSIQAPAADVSNFAWTRYWIPNCTWCFIISVWMLYEWFKLLVEQT